MTLLNVGLSIFLILLLFLYPLLDLAIAKIFGIPLHTVGDSEGPYLTHYPEAKVSNTQAHTHPSSASTSDPTLAQLTCDVCGDEHVIGVLSSTFGAISFAFCIECAKKPAEPKMMFDFLYDEVGDKGEGLHESVNRYYTWIDGKYVSWQDYKQERQTNKS